jgi:hypothetical protein
MFKGGANDINLNNNIVHGEKKYDNLEVFYKHVIENDGEALAKDDTNMMMMRTHFNLCNTSYSHFPAETISNLLRVLLWMA